MKKNYLLLLLPAALLAIALSCKSAPKTADETPKEEVKAELDLKALNDSAARAEAARKRAIDFDTPAYFPSEWQSAESGYSEAGSTPRDSAENVQKAAALYDAAAAAYDGLFEKAVPLYAQAREDEIMASRDKLLTSDFTHYYPDLLDSADFVALEAWDQYENKDYYASRDTAARALLMYETMNAGAGAYLTREEIIIRAFMVYDEENFARADEAGDKAIDAYNAEDMKAARDNADEAQLRYNLVLNTGWVSYTSERAAVAGTQRQRALDVKGNVASRNEFNAANEVYNKAVGLLKEEMFSEASALFKNSELQFSEVIKITEEKRVVAEDAIREAEERAEASDEAARKAEEIIEGGSE